MEVVKYSGLSPHRKHNIHHLDNYLFKQDSRRVNDDLPPPTQQKKQKKKRPELITNEEEGGVLSVRKSSVKVLEFM